MGKPRRMRWAEYVARMTEIRHAFKIFVEKPERKRPLGRPGCRWEDNIELDLGEQGLGVD
jgi:hypothetical protein